MATEKIQLIYDKECPACDNYCQWVRLNETLSKDQHRELQLINAREHPDAIEKITQMGLDIDQGMVIIIDDALYYGSDAIHILALMSSQIGVFNKTNYWLFKSKRRAYFLYPLLRTGRNMLLKLLGKTKINNLKRDNNTHF
jgi:predicted DCC family thiol-disulfide oxidoreductase YuxK